MKKIFDNLQQRMDKTINNLNMEYSSIQAGRANPKLLSKITVDYYGTPTPINQIAAISVSEATVLVIQPWDISTLNLIEKAIQKSDIGIHPQNDGKVLRLVFPKLTEDRRKEISKDISKMAEDSKISIRTLRRDAIDKLKNMKKGSEITEDELKKGEKNIQNLTDKFCDTIDKLCKDKTTEIMEI